MINVLLDIFMCGLGVASGAFALVVARTPTTAPVDVPRPARPPYRALFFGLTLTLGFVAIAWLGLRDPLRVWTRYGAPAGHGFAVGVLGIGGALMLGVQTVSVYRICRGLMGKPDS